MSASGASGIDTLAREQYCYLTTTGRRTGSPHTIEIWFAMSDDRRKLYMLSGGAYRADWVRNIQADPSVAIRINNKVLTGTGRVVAEMTEEQLARRLVVSKYYGRDEVRTTGWEATSLPVAIDLSQ